MKPTGTAARFAAVVASLGVTRVVADPVSMYGVGGSLRPMSGEHRAIRMVEEEVRVKLPEREVEARYVFRNDGAATMVVMGFPEVGQPGDTGQFPRSGFLRGFRSSVDGRPVPVHRVVPPHGLAGKDSYESAYQVFWVKRVRFGRGQQRVLRDTYRGGNATEMMNAPEGGARQLFSYILQTGASWKGPIGRVRVAFDIAGLRNFSDIRFDTPGYRRRGDKIVWEWRNLEPAHDIGASWWPGFNEIVVNGEEPLTRCAIVGRRREQGRYDAVYPQRRGDHISVPLRLLEEWLRDSPDAAPGGASQGAGRNDRVVRWGGRSVTATVGSRWLKTAWNGTAGRVEMPLPAYREKGLVVVELASVVRALGGQAAWNHGKFYLTLR